VNVLDWNRVAGRGQSPPPAEDRVTWPFGHWRELVIRTPVAMRQPTQFHYRLLRIRRRAPMSAIAFDHMRLVGRRPRLNDRHGTGQFSVWL
jgi:hypothetical protein